MIPARVVNLEWGSVGSAKGNCSNCVGEILPDWRHGSRSIETNEAVPRVICLFWPAKSMFRAKENSEREMPCLTGGGASHERTTLPPGTGKNTGKTRCGGQLCRPRLAEINS